MNNDKKGSGKHSEQNMTGFHSGDKLEFSSQKERTIVAAPQKNVDDLFGKLFNPERKALSCEAINESLQRKFKPEKL